MKKVIRANKSLGSGISDYQKWVDFDMEKYGKISDTTMKDIKKAGLSVVKDQYGDYEVIADDKVEGGCHGKKKVTASLGRTHRTRIVFTPGSSAEGIEIIFDIPNDVDDEEYIEDYLDGLLNEDLKYNCEWDFI